MANEYRIKQAKGKLERLEREFSEAVKHGLIDKKP